MGIGGRKGLVLLFVDVVPFGWAGVLALVGIRIFVAHLALLPTHVWVPLSDDPPSLPMVPLRSTQVRPASQAATTPATSGSLLRNEWSPSTKTA